MINNIVYKMRRILAVVLSVAFVLSSLVLVMGFCHDQGTQSNSALAESSSLLFGINSTASLNWAGYAVTGSNVSSVTGSFVVPSLGTSTSSGGGHGHSGKNVAQPGLTGLKAKPSNGKGGSGGSSQTSYAAFWAGIDGYNSNTVEQAGIMMEDQNGISVYRAWYEFYPAAPVYASWSPNPGDHVVVYVNYTVSNSTFVATVIDSTLGEKYVSPYTTVSGAQRSSAEWIAEAPASGSSILPLADFGTVYFGSDYAGSGTGNYATVSGTFGTIGTLANSFSVYAMNMEKRNGSLKAQTSSLSTDGTSFAVTWKNS